MLITDVKAWIVESQAQKPFKKHWVTETIIANPMSVYPQYHDTRSSWGLGAMGGFVVEITTDNGLTGYGIGGGGEAACVIVEKHFKRLLRGQDPRDVEMLWDQMFRASLPYGRKGVPIMAISGIDLALWDLCGKYYGVPVYKLIGGKTKENVPVYATGVRPEIYKELGFRGAKLPLPYGPADGWDGLKKNVALVATTREKVGPDFDIMLDCYMALSVPYTIELAKNLEPYRVKWIEEFLIPDDYDGHAAVKAAVQSTLLATGEHEYTRYGFRELIARQAVDILQPDINWVGGITETCKIAAMAAAYDVPVIPHAGGTFSVHFVMSHANCPMAEFGIVSPGGDEVAPILYPAFTGEPLPENGAITLTEKPGWGLEPNHEGVNWRRPFPIE